MRYWTFVTPSDDGKGEPVYDTLSEYEIIKQYYPYWSEKMIKKYGQEEFNRNWSKQECIEDWITVNWAWESA